MTDGRSYAAENQEKFFPLKTEQQSDDRCSILTEVKEIMKIDKSEVTKIRISGVKHLDLINVIIDNLGSGKGRVIIECYGKSWCSYWGGMGSDTSIERFFCSCDNQYLVENLAPQLKSTIYDIDQIKKDAEKKGIECWRDDPWNDYGFMSEMYGGDMYEWDDLLPDKEKHEYAYLCRIINAVKNALKDC